MSLHNLKPAEKSNLNAGKRLEEVKELEKVGLLQEVIKVRSLVQDTPKK